MLKNDCVCVVMLILINSAYGRCSVVCLKQFWDDSVMNKVGWCWFLFK